ncbi:hypothetical protein HOLleu_45264 [Holothuria leucospilota]|uniref:DUF6570 domain-containing protein n=1 Tax=Holothuria leucospilota TaxID=206669 RepID=A0A9Q0Y898_HOLLE|nr:hypothetical protein HOLleu_45264 [Holothuria leucospilota]
MLLHNYCLRKCLSCEDAQKIYFPPNIIYFSVYYSIKVLKTQQVTFLSSDLQHLFATSKWWILTYKKHCVSLLYNGAIHVFDPYCHKDPNLKSGSYVVSLKNIQEFNMFMCGLLSTIFQDFSASDICYLHCVNILQPKILDGINIEWCNVTPDVTMPLVYDSYKSIENQSNDALKDLIDVFHKAVQQGPVYICSCCEQLWFKRSVENVKTVSSKIVAHLQWCITNILSFDNEKYLCTTCIRNLKQGDKPLLATSNNLSFGNIPPALVDLYPLEERLVAARIPFMQIRALPCGDQLKLKGSVVNVPANVSTTISVLPRTLNEAEIITLRLKRKLEFSHDYLFDNVRPFKVLEAAIWLVNNSPLYKAEKISLLDDYNPSNMFSNENCTGLSVSSPQHLDEIHCPNPQLPETNLDNQPDEEDNWTEIDSSNPSITGNLETLLDDQFPTTVLPKLVLSIAPGEGNHPLGIFKTNIQRSFHFPHYLVEMLDQ